MKTKLLSVLISIFVALLIVTLSITLPILIRPFYYAQIDSFDLPKKYSYEVVKTAYDEMMDYCLGLRSEFSVGELPYSESGASHFADVRALFIHDFVIIAVSAISLIAIAIILKKKNVAPHRFHGRSAPFWSVVSIGSICAVIGIACAINFRATFRFFHYLFFIGKTNWEFDPVTDPIILLLPNEFFSACGVLIFASILVSCVAILLYEFLPRKKKN